MRVLGWNAVLACLLVAARISAPCQTSAASTVLTSFASGTVPVSSLVAASDGNYYGVTESGGSYGFGSVYRMTPGGAVTNIYSFTGGNDGGLPIAGLVEALDGRLYGTTIAGGANQFGTVFALTLSGSLTVVHSFDPDDDGTSPNTALTLGSDGTLYGTLAQGGFDSFTGQYYCGTIFSVHNGVYQDLYSFPEDGSLGAQPAARLLEASDGNLWGATSSEGANGYGNIFMFGISGSSAGVLTSVYSLAANDGEVLDGLVEQRGTLYGVTFPVLTGDGEIFSVSLSGSFAVEYSFTGAADGGAPATALFPGSDGHLYGMTQSGGANGTGTFFQVGTTGTPITLANLPAGSINSLADAALLESKTGGYLLPVEYDVTPDLMPEAMDGAGSLLQLTPAYSPAPAAPVSLALSPAQPNAGSSATLTWNAANAASLTAQTCFASGGWSGAKPAQGSQSVTVPSGTTTYAITCGGNVSALAVVNTALKATVSIAGPTSVQQNANATASIAVSGPQGSPVATGHVSLVVNGSTIATVALSNGKASLTVAATIAAGVYSVVVTYSGDANYQAASSAPVSVTVTAKASTSTTLTLGTNPVKAGGSETFTAKVARSGSSTNPSGTVQFWSGSSMLGQASLSGGKATCNMTISVPSGTYPIVAKYLGDSGDNASTSSTVNLQVK